MREDLESVAAGLVADGKGILAADESVATLTRRFDTLGIKSTEQSRRAYRGYCRGRPRGLPAGTGTRFGSAVQTLVPGSTATA
jgi:hypothetical protein